MLKKVILFCLIATIFSCKEETATSYNINAKIDGGINGLRAYLKTQAGNGRFIVKDTAIIMNEHFSFSGSTKTPNLQYLFIDSYNGKLPLVVENGEISLEIDKDNFMNSKAYGTQNNDLFSSYLNDVKSLETEIKSIRNDFITRKNNGENVNMEDFKSKSEANRKSTANLALDFMQKNKSSYTTLFIANMVTASNMLEIGELNKAFQNLDGELKNSELGKQLNSKIKQRIQTESISKNTKIGSTAENFSGLTPEDVRLTLNDIKAKVIIIDFWASWCGPCRRENPNVVKMYNEYHDKGLEILGVSLDNPGQKNRWIQAIEKDKLTWPQVSNLKGWKEPIAKQYGVRSIPATFILDENYKIIAKNLRGKALENKIAKLLD